MRTIIVQGLGKSYCLDYAGEDLTLCELQDRVADVTGIPANLQRLSVNCKELASSTHFTESEVSEWGTIKLSLRLLGGKGGFGALLRGASSKAGQKKNTNFGDCRDLNGRRIRQVKNEKKLAEWASTESERKAAEEEKKEKKKRKTEEVPVKTFNDASFHERLNSINDEIENSVEAALKAKKLKDMEAKKRKAEEEKQQNEKKKKKRRFIWDDLEEVEDDDEEVGKD